MSKKNIIYSIVLGLLLSVSFYLGLHDIGGFWLPSTIQIVGVLFICILIAINLKKENGGYVSFGNLVKHYAIVISIASSINMVINIVQTSMMDEDQKEAIIENSIESTMEIYSGFGMTEEQLSNIDVEKNIEDIFKPSRLILNGVMAILFYILISMIPAAIMKKNPTLT